MEVAVCAIAKNENLYIREWVEWYKNLGISKIFLYDNNELDGERFEEVINDHIESDFVEVIDVRGVDNIYFYGDKEISLNSKYYIDFYQTCGKFYDWICFFDINEFLTFNDEYNLFNFLEQQKFYDVDQILISNKENTNFKTIIKTNINSQIYKIQKYIFQECCLIYKNNKIKNLKKVIYTCITGNYDNLIEPDFISDGFDYICFTDNPNLKSNIWKIIPIPKELSKLSKVKQQRNIKINTHKYLPQYDLSIWVDTSVSLSSNINNILYKLDFSNYNIFITIHPDRDCIYQEGKKCIELKKDTEKNINKELNIFKENGMPEHYGLLETNVIIKLHNMPSCKHLMEMWCDYLNSYSHRDQISLPYCLWKLNYTKLYKLPKNFNHTKYFNYDPGTHYITNICIVHYNTPELTNALIKNINKIVKRPKIWIFDNSDKYPFIYKYDNLIYIDNTKGQYINFDKWLENYPTRLLSKEGTQSYGSAKHSISIQKCIELINDNFILMDSDILIKKDISFMFNKRYLYVGTSEKQPKVKDIYRVLPFICFINVDIMKKYNLTYFNENYMHGLHLTKEGDWYDTGGNFYRISRKFPYLEINIWDYIIHYKGGSWEEIHNNRIGRELTSKEWLEINKKYWE